MGGGQRLLPDARRPEVLDFYAERSPIFMAAKFDASRAAELGQTTGDGTPIMLTIPTTEGRSPSARDAGIDVVGDARPIVHGSGRPWWPLIAGIASGLGIAIFSRWQWVAQRRERTT